MKKIPILDLSFEIETLWGELNAAIQGVLRSGSFVMGPEVKAFESEVSDYLGVEHAIGVNSGTDALVIALRALGVGPGDEVVTTPFTFFASAEAISQVGATPVFVDIDSETYNMDPYLLEAKITPRTRAIMPVHLFGQAAELDPILAVAEKHGLGVVEDVAQALGGKYKGKALGSFGDVGAFSFFPSKNLGAYGDGGLIATDDDKFADVARMLRTHGAKRKYHNEMIGYNSRLDEIQAAILRVKLPYLDEWNAKRRRAAARYDDLLDDVPGIVTPREGASAEHVYHQYTVRVSGGRRDEVHERLAAAGVGTMIYYPVPVPELPVYAVRKDWGNFPRVRAAAGEVLSLPMWPQITPDVQMRVAAALREVLA